MYNIRIIQYIGKDGATNSDEFSEKFQRGWVGHFKSKDLCCRSWVLREGVNAKKNVFFRALPEGWGGGSTHARIFWPSFNKRIFGQ